MRTFIIKAVNVGLICAVLYGYQGYAMERSRQIEEYEKEEAVARKAWNKVEQQKGESSVSSLTDGIYEGSGTGFGGEIRVQIVVQGGEILSANIVSAEKETPDYLKSAEKILTEVVNKQSADVDTISGATLSSNGILEGVRNALEDSDGKEK